jgi:hypothetical protein
MVDWKAMTPREVWEAMRSAPKTFKDGSGAMRPDHRDDAATLLSKECDTPQGRKDEDEAMRVGGWLLVD